MFPVVCRVARYDRHGSARRVTRLVEETIHSMGSHQVLVRMLAAPINPADFNMIEGVYNIRPELPAIGGNEGVGVVEAVGEHVTSLKPGDWVIPSQPGFGTWRTHAVCEPGDMDRIANDIPAEQAATVAVNPCSAYRMLRDFVSLKAGDVIIQNGSNSGVGQAVIQLARHKGIRTVNILRDRPNYEEIAGRLKGLGADMVISQSELLSGGKAVREQILEAFDGRLPVLGLNCVGGKSATEIARLLGDHGCHVTYGGMSRLPVTVPTGRLIFNDISIRGFWLSRWIDENPKQERLAMIEELTDLIREGKLAGHVEKRPFETGFEEALEAASTHFRDHKVVFDFGLSRQ